MHQSLQYNYKVTQSFDVSSGVWYQTEYNLKKMRTAEFPIELVGNPLPTFSHEYRFNVYTLIENYIENCLFMKFKQNWVIQIR